MARPTIVLAAVLSLAASSAPADTDHCARLRALSEQWRGVALTVEQGVTKAALLRWYTQHCSKRGREKGFG